MLLEIIKIRKNSNVLTFNYIVGQRSQDLEPFYFENGLLYITKALIFEILLFQKMLFHLKCKTSFANVDIDT
jgi:N-acylneuraminate cytidylyltransferase